MFRDPGKHPSFHPLLPHQPYNESWGPRPCKPTSPRPQRSPPMVCSGTATVFSLYNSIASDLSCSYKIFADDLKIYACIDYPKKSSPAPSSSMSIQRDINVLCSTAASWGLHMNVKKCAVLRFSRCYAYSDPPAYLLNGIPIPSVQSSTDLGVTVDTELKFHAHIRTVSHKAGGLAHSFLKSTVCRSVSFMIFLLTTHILPLI